jgi:hypothetical protein
MEFFFLKFFLKIVSEFFDLFLFQKLFFVLIDIQIIL